MELHYFLTTNGSQGHYSYLEHELADCSRVIRFAGYPRKTAAALLREAYAVAKQNRMNMHILHNCLDNSTEGIIFPDLRAAVINLPVYESRFDLASLFHISAVDLYKKHMNQAFEHFTEAKKIHDRWEQIYIGATHYPALEELSEKLITELLADAKAEHPGTFSDRFFGAATINGSQDYIEALSENTRRFFIKGRPGTGKSTFLKKLATAAYERGFRIERYHCSFDPDSLDMVIIRELSLCIFDSTAPHEYFPSRETDKLLDFYAAAVKPDTDLKYETELKSLAESYKTEIEKAVKQLIAANADCIQAEEAFEKQIDKNRLMEIRKDMIQQIFP